MKRLTESQLKEAAYGITDGDVKKLTLEKLHRMMTVTQFVTAQCLNEIEERGELTYDPETGDYVNPYQSDYVLPTILNPTAKAGALGGTGRQQKVASGPSFDDSQLYVTQALAFSAKILQLLPNGKRPEGAIEEMQAALEFAPEPHRELADAEIELWLQYMSPA